MIEEWKPITGFDGYEISNKGAVRNINSGRILRSSVSQVGYEQVVLRRNNKSYSKRVHRMVIEEFNPIENMERFNVMHKDGNKLNNCIDNLEWTTIRTSGMYPVGGNDMRKLHMLIYHAIKRAVNEWQGENISEEIEL